MGPTRSQAYQFAGSVGCSRLLGLESLSTCKCVFPCSINDKHWREKEESGSFSSNWKGHRIRQGDEREADICTRHVIKTQEQQRLLGASLSIHHWRDSTVAVHSGQGDIPTVPPPPQGTRLSFRSAYHRPPNGPFSRTVFHHSGRARRQPIKQPTETPTKTMALMSCFPSLMRVFRTWSAASP